MNRRKFFVLTAGATAGSLLLPRPSQARGRILEAPPRADIPGDFCFYDAGLEELGEGQYLMQAELIKAEGEAKLLNWGRNGRALRYDPEKAGDAITFKISIGSVQRNRECRIVTVAANFSDEGIYQMLVDGEPFGEPHDCFSRASWEHGTLPILPGDYEISYRYTGEKNPKSRGNGLNLMRLEFK